MKSRRPAWFLIAASALTLAASGMNASPAQLLIPIQTDSTTLVFQVTGDKHLNLLYLGPAASAPKDGGSIPGDVVYPTNAASGNASWYAGQDEPGKVAVRATHADGDPACDLIYVRHTIRQVGAAVTETRIELKDVHHPFYVNVFVRSNQGEDLFEQWTQIRHQENAPVTLRDFASAGLTFHADAYWLTFFPAAYQDEMQLTEARLQPGIKSVESKLGIRNGQSAAPDFALSLGRRATEAEGRVLLGTLAWSGSFANTFEVDRTNRLRILSGINSYASEWHLTPGEIFETPKFLFTFSTQGKGEASRRFHRWARLHGVRDGNKPQLTLLNNWEATEFNFDQTRIESLFQGAKAAGMEIFLLDDGWFGNGKYARINDKAGLGDWQPNPARFPRGLGPLVQSALSRGLQFGIWMEPEMVNPASQLYTRHPEWVITQPHRPASLFRNQMVLDLTRPEVQQYAFNAIDGVLSTPGISYLKWDCNRSIDNPGSAYLPPYQQSHVRIAYVRALYQIMRRVVEKHPGVTMMACSGGGGRVDYGSLRFFQQFWPSDNTDALCRVKIQWGYSHFYPAAAISAHVTRMNSRPFKFAFDVAMSGRLGMDVDTGTLTAEESVITRQAVALYKSELRDVVQFGDLYRLESPYEGSRASLDYVTQDKAKAVAFAWQLEDDVASAGKPFRVTGLKPDFSYVVKEVNLKPGVTSRLPANGQAFTGAELMREGITLGFEKRFDSATIEFTAG
ncbi:MAG: alpha-galactosidase [Verrucomicrobia bacterium]|nr:alpha-galactosidase [Verrucomicrobiota bacterium]